MINVYRVSVFSRPYLYSQAVGTIWRLSSVHNVCTVRRRGSALVLLDRALVRSDRLSIVTMSLSAAVWPQFARQCPPASMFAETVSYSFTVIGSKWVNKSLNAATGIWRHLGFCASDYPGWFVLRAQHTCSLPHAQSVHRKSRDPAVCVCACVWSYVCAFVWLNSLCAFTVCLPVSVSPLLAILCYFT